MILSDKDFVTIIRSKLSVEMWPLFRCHYYSVVALRFEVSSSAQDFTVGWSNFPIIIMKLS